MAVYFELISKDTGEATKFAEIDVALARAFGDAPHEDNWYENWYNVLGIQLAMGNSWDELRAHCREWYDDMPERGEKLTVICDWLEERYTVHCWSGR